MFGLDDVLEIKMSRKWGLLYQLLVRLGWGDLLRTGAEHPSAQVVVAIEGAAVRES